MYELYYVPGSYQCELYTQHSQQGFFVACICLVFQVSRKPTRRRRRGGTDESRVFRILEYNNTYVRVYGTNYDACSHVTPPCSTAAGIRHYNTGGVGAT